MKLLRSKESTLAVLIIALVAQLPHAAYVFAHIGNQDTGWLQTAHSYSYAIALELAVLLFVVRNKNLESYGFALVSVLINLSYYNMHEVVPFSLAAFPAWLVSVALPVAIARYSHDIAHEAIEPVRSAIEPAVSTGVTLNNHITVQSTAIAPTQVVQSAIEPRTEQEKSFWNMLNEGAQYKITVLARELNVAPNTLRSWRERWNDAQQPAMAGD